MATEATRNSEPRAHTASRYSAGKLRRYLRPVVAVAVPLAIWQLAANMGWINSFLFPAPLAIAKALWVQAGPHGNPPYAVLYSLLHSLWRICAGVGLALVFGTLIGLAIGLTGWGRAMFRPIISIILPVPTLAWTPVLLLVFGIDDRTTITVVFIAASLQIIYNVVAGIETLNLRVFWVARSMGASRMQLFIKVIVPGIFPYLLTGLRLGVGFAWRALIAAEMLAASSFGLGLMISNAVEYLNMDIIFGGIVLIALMGCFFEYVIFGWIEMKTVKRWGVQVER